MDEDDGMEYEEGEGEEQDEGEEQEDFEWFRILNRLVKYRSDALIKSFHVTCTIHV